MSFLYSSFLYFSHRSISLVSLYIVSFSPLFCFLTKSKQQAKACFLSRSLFLFLKIKSPRMACCFLLAVRPRMALILSILWHLDANRTVPSLHSIATFFCSSETGSSRCYSLPKMTKHSFVSDEKSEHVLLFVFPVYCILFCCFCFSNQHQRSCWFIFLFFFSFCY